jgi:hypothetical protein
MCVIDGCTTCLDGFVCLEIFAVWVVSDALCSLFVLVSQEYFNCWISSYKVRHIRLHNLLGLIFFLEIFAVWVFSLFSDALLCSLFVLVTSGDATLAGFSVTREPEQTRRRTGVSMSLVLYHFFSRLFFKKSNIHVCFVSSTPSQK